MNEKNNIRRSVSIPKEIDEYIAYMTKRYNYVFKNDLIVELLELGIIKYNENTELKNTLNKFLDNIDVMYKKLGIK